MDFWAEVGVGPYIPKKCAFGNGCDKAQWLCKEIKGAKTWECAWRWPKGCVWWCCGVSLAGGLTWDVSPLLQEGRSGRARSATAAVRAVHTWW